MRKLIAAILLSALTVVGADLTGKWSGSFELNSPEGKKTPPAFLILKQEGTKLTGSGGPDESKQNPFDNGKVEGNKVTFSVPAGNSSINFDMTIEGDELKGKAWREGDNGREDATASFKRVK